MGIITKNEDSLPSNAKDRSSKVNRCLKGTPVPVARHAGGNVGLAAQGLGQRAPRAVVPRQVRGVRHEGGRGGVAVPLHLRVQLVLDDAEALEAGLVPAQVGAVALVAGARGHAVRVEARVLVERHEVGGVRSAEDVAAVAAVVPPQEEAEEGAAGGRVAGRGGRVGLEQPRQQRNA